MIYIDMLNKIVCSPDPNELFFNYACICNIFEEDFEENNVLPAIEDTFIANAITRLKASYEKAKDSFANIFNEFHVFIDDTFCCSTDWHDIFCCLALECFEMKVLEGLTCCWIASDVGQLMCDKHTYSYEKFLMRYVERNIAEVKDKYSAVVRLNAVMRCSKTVFKQWRGSMSNLQQSKDRMLFIESGVSKHMTTYEVFQAEYGFNHPGSVIYLYGFKNIVNLVEDIKKRIKSLTKDTFLSLSNFAILCCDRPGHDMVLNAVKKCLQHDGTFDTGSIAECLNENKIVCDSFQYSFGLEWPVVFVVSATHSFILDVKCNFQNYVACSRSRVRLYVYAL